MPKRSRTRFPEPTALSEYELRRLATETMSNVRTVRTAYASPWKVRPSTLHRLTNAAKLLGFRPPNDVAFAGTKEPYPDTLCDGVEPSNDVAFAGTKEPYPDTLCDGVEP